MIGVSVQVTYKNQTLLGVVTKEEETNLSVVSAFSMDAKVVYKEYLHNAKYSDEVIISNIDKVCN